jgi:transketolase
MAIGAQIRGEQWRTFVVTGDGELQEGSNWEAAMLAGHRSLGNLTLIVDRNRLQQGARTEETNALDPLDAKFEAFGWQAVEIDGHDHELLRRVLSRSHYKPLVIIANTIKGRGVSFMEDLAVWHHKVPSPEQVDAALAEIGPSS